MAHLGNGWKTLLHLMVCVLLLAGMGGAKFVRRSARRRKTDAKTATETRTGEKPITSTVEASVEGNARTAFQFSVSGSSSGSAVDVMPRFKSGVGDLGARILLSALEKLRGNKQRNHDLDVRLNV